MIDEIELDQLLRLAETLRDEARAELWHKHPARSLGAEVAESVATDKVKQSNVIRKALLALGYRAVGPEWQIENRRVVPVPGT